MKRKYLIDYLFEAIEELLYPTKETNPVEVVAELLTKIPGAIVDDIGSIAEEAVLQGKLIFYPTSDKPRRKVAEFRFLKDDQAIVEGDGIDFIGPWPKALEVIADLVPGDKLMAVGAV